MTEDVNDLRRRNRETVARYMATRGQDRLRRHELFTQDGVGGLWTTDTGEPIEIRGRDALERHAVWSLKCFPDWEWYDVTIHEEVDPDHFWVECEGRGAIRFDGYPEGHYENHFLFSFEMDSGAIVRCREFMNPVRQFWALGIDVPTIRRRGIPTR